jgi:transposase
MGGMLVVETIAKIRRLHLVEGRPIKAICRDLGLSRKVVRKVVRSGATEFRYERTRQPLPKLGPWQAELDRLLAENTARPSRERLTLVRLFEALRGLGYAGGYDTVRRYARAWEGSRAWATAGAFVPLQFAPGEAYQFDWSHEVVLIGGVTVTVKVAHIRLCHSRMMFVRAYPRETQEMVFDAHDRAFAFFRGACTRGIYDSEAWPPPVRGHAEQDRGGRDLRRPRAGLQPALPADVQPLSGRALGLHAGLGVGRAPARHRFERRGERARSRTKLGWCASGSSRRGCGWGATRS